MTIKPQWPAKKLLSAFPSKYEKVEAEVWNACHDAFMKVIDSQPKEKLVNLDDRLRVLINNAYHACRSAQSYGESYHVGRAEDMLKEALDLVITFGTPPKSEVPSVEDIKSIIYQVYFKNRELMQSNNALLLNDYAQAIHQRLKERKKVK